MRVCLRHFVSSNHSWCPLAVGFHTFLYRMPGKQFSGAPTASTVQQSRFRCQLCKKLFSSETTLRRHNRRCAAPASSCAGSAIDLTTPPPASPATQPAAAAAPPITLREASPPSRGACALPAGRTLRGREPGDTLAPPSPTTRITCEDCGKTFAEKRNLVRHQRVYCRVRRAAGSSSLQAPALRRHASCPSEYEAL